MSLTYEVFMKHADKVCKNASEVRSILKGVKHFENGDAVATDSHRLYLAKGVHTRTDGAVLTSSGTELEGNYPDVSRLIPDKNYAKQSLHLNVKDLLKAADIMASVGGVVQEKPVLEFKEDVIRFLSPEIKIHYSFYPLRFEEQICANAVYFLDAMKLFKAIGCEEVTLRFYGTMRPFTLVNEQEDVTALILPVRKY